MGTPAMAVGPSPEDWAVAALHLAGGRLVDPPDAAGLIWTTGRRVDELSRLLGEHPAIEWVHVVPAGIEPLVTAGVVDSTRQWTAGKGAYAIPVAEHALALALALRRNLVLYARATSWGDPGGAGLVNAKVLILGAGGVARALVRLLDPLGCDVTVVRRRRESMDGATVAVWRELEALLREADLVVLALALTDETRGVINAARLARMKRDAVLVNVARGGHVVTDDLIAALDDGQIAGAALDVTDPEPLPPGHPLWSSPRCIITPHTANPPDWFIREGAARITENVRRFAQGEPLLGAVDRDAGY